MRNSAVHVTWISLKPADSNSRHFVAKLSIHNQFHNYFFDIREIAKEHCRRILHKCMLIICKIHRTGKYYTDTSWNDEFEEFSWKIVGEKIYIILYRASFTKLSWHDLLWIRWISANFCIIREEKCLLPNHNDFSCWKVKAVSIQC